MSVICRLSCLSIFLCLVGCTPAPPHKPRDVCSVFRQYPRWYASAHAAEKRWGVPVSTQMAIINEESRFHGDARPARGKILWIIPWARPTTAEGYAQAVNGTWRLYLRETQRSRASRSSFDAATDFIGWFAARAHHKLGISTQDTYSLYLAYHEGIEGYREKSYQRKPWLKRIAHHVSALAARYHQQLIRCEHTLPHHHWWQVFG